MGDLTPVDHFTDLSVQLNIFVHDSRSDNVVGGAAVENGVDVAEVGGVGESACGEIISHYA